jgi:predicted N-acyltransferase
MTEMSNDYRLTVYESIAGIDRDRYNEIIDGENPSSKTSSSKRWRNPAVPAAIPSWNPRHIVLYDADRIIGAVTAYIKSDSYGEYIFDWEARAFENARLRTTRSWWRQSLSLLRTERVFRFIPTTRLKNARIMVDR